MFRVLLWLIEFILGDRIIEEVGLRMLDHSYALVTVLLVLARDEDPIVAKKAVSVGTAFYRSILEEMAMQVCTLSQVGYVVIRIYYFIFS